MSRSDQEILVEIAHTARASLEFALGSAQSGRSVAGACLHGSVLFCMMASRWWAGVVLIRGGDGASDGGYVDGRGRCHGHYWVEACRGRDVWVIDITADQFGDECVAVAARQRVTSRYVPGDQDVVDAAVASICADLDVHPSDLTD